MGAVNDNQAVSSNYAPSYLRAWLTNPFTFGAVAPSGPALSALITSEISAETGCVLELGPGKGVITQALLDRGVPESNLILVERMPDFARLLRERFPLAHVEIMDADQISGLKLLTKDEPVGAVVSSLPLVSMPPDKVGAILVAAFEHLGPAGAFYQFTYAPRSPVSDSQLTRLGLKADHIGRAVLNIPPAAVYRITRIGTA